MDVCKYMDVYLLYVCTYVCRYVCVCIIYVYVCMWVCILCIFCACGEWSGGRMYYTCEVEHDLAPIGTNAQDEFFPFSPIGPGSTLSKDRPNLSLCTHLQYHLHNKCFVSISGINK